MFADLYSTRGRRSIAPRTMATVMLLQRFEGLSDSEAVDRLSFDLRYKWACGLAYDAPSFDSTLLVDMRARLRSSAAPNRIFDAVLDVAKKANLVGKKRILDSTALYDAVATQDTVTLVRSAIVGVFRAAEGALEGELRKLCKRDDAYDRTGKPSCAWDDKNAREELVDALTRDANAILSALHDAMLSAELNKAAALLATVVGQDIEQGEDGLFRIFIGVAKDRVISTVDPETRHGHKTSARGFDGYKGHIAICPDSELITAMEVTPGNVGDATVAEALIGDLIEEKADAGEVENETNAKELLGDSSYGTADFIELLEQHGIAVGTRVQPPSSRDGLFSQERFEIDLGKQEVTCPAGTRVRLRVLKDGSSKGDFGEACSTCERRGECTKSKSGRTINVHKKHALLDRHRKLQRDPKWKERYRKTRPIVERKIAHATRRKHGGRRMRVRGLHRIRPDYLMLGASLNLARLAALGVRIEEA
jgi:transposase